MQIEVIQPGETLWAISQRYGVPVEEIARLNGLDPQKYLVAGQTLVVPTRSTHTVQPGESFWSIAQTYGISVDALVKSNPTINPATLQPGMVLKLPQRKKIEIESNAYLQPSNTEKDRRIINESATPLTYLSLFSYRVTKEGELIVPSDQIALEALKTKDVSPMMVITNFADGNFQADIAQAVFQTETREKLINNVLKVMKQKGFKALNIDFEHIYPQDREKYTAFLRYAVPRLKEAGYIVSTALAPKTSATQVGQWYEAHDYAAHGQIVDFVIIMTYEWGWSGGPPLAVAPIPQVRRVLDYAVSVIPRGKIIMGAPLYGYDWTLPYVPGGKFARTLNPQAAIEQARKYQARIEYDYQAQAPYYRYYDNQGKEHIVWFEDARSAQAKFNLLKEFRLRGISYWVLGNPFPQNWLLLEDNFKIKKY